MSKSYFVYIMASKKNGTLYVGVTNDLRRRVCEHKDDINDGFSRKYKTHDLVYFESTNDIRTAILFEKKLKGWKRKWKVDLINRMNPGWKDLSGNV